MHEMSLAEGVLQVVEDSARDQGFSRVKTVWLEIGALAGVEADAIRFCFDLVMKDTLAEGARLEIVTTEGRGCCLSCGQNVPVRLRYDPCPLCGGYPVEPTGGMEMRVKELEVE
ncbi:MAG TPA: hydrogenase maturation nickel metallochaperone HypA [Sulfuricella sp.]|nr:hydrogenase maturation nickel metallochaperone HypA [Sulfuricella sp.]